MIATARPGATLGVVLGALVMTLGSPAAVLAQGFAVRSGPSLNPAQLYGGVQYSFAPAWETLRPTPGLDFGVANGAPFYAVNLDGLLQSRPVGPGSEWTVLLGGGPAINRYRHTMDRTRAGMNTVGGLSHKSGWFGELRIGFFDSVGARFGVGYRPGARQQGRAK